MIRKTCSCLGGRRKSIEYGSKNIEENIRSDKEARKIEKLSRALATIQGKNEEIVSPSTAVIQEKNGEDARVVGVNGVEDRASIGGSSASTDFPWSDDSLSNDGLKTLTPSTVNVEFVEEINTEINTDDTLSEAEDFYSVKSADDSEADDFHSVKSYASRNSSKTSDNTDLSAMNRCEEMMRDFEDEALDTESSLLSSQPESEPQVVGDGEMVASTNCIGATETKKERKLRLKSEREFSLRILNKPEVSLSPSDMAAVEGLTPENQGLFECALQELYVFPLDWKIGYQSAYGASAYYYEPHSTYALLHHTVFLPNCTVAEAVAGTAEISQWPAWHPTVTAIQHVGPVDKCYDVRHGHNRVMMVIKNDFVCHTHRFMFNGIVLETATPVLEGEEGYVKQSGSRTYVKSSLLYAPVEGGVIMISHIHLDIGMVAPTWLVNFALRRVIPSLVKDFQKLVENVKSEKKPYKKIMSEDKLGLYSFINSANMRPEFVPKTWYDLTTLRPIMEKYTPLTAAALDDAGRIPINRKFAMPA